jgi:erythromycin esterase-like protein
LRGSNRAGSLLPHQNLQRAIGVIYRPESERVSHYFHANLVAQFDAVIHFDQTTAVSALEAAPTAASREVEETYPTGV